MSDDAPNSSEQTTTAQQPSMAPPVGPTQEEHERLRAEAEEWRRLALSQAPPQQNYQQPTYQPAQTQAFSYQDGTPRRPPASLAIENPDEYDRQMDRYEQFRDQQTLQTAAGFAGPQLADAGKFMSQSDPAYREVWTKYGSEIEQEMVKNSVPTHMRTKQSWDLLAGIVQGRHYRELADELANKRLQNGGFGTESGSNVGGAPANTGDPLAAFWTEGNAYVEKLKNTGMSLQGLRNHIASQHLTEQQWIDDIKKGRSFTAQVA